MPPLKPEYFAAAVARERGLSLAELPRGDTVDVAGHKPFFDSARGLWTCDIRICPDDPYPYHSWVRLALVRYQPHALPDAKLSRVALADFAALPMDRAVLLTYDPYTPEKVAVTVSGRSYAVTADTQGMPDVHSSHIDVRVERRVADIRDPVLGWEPANLLAAVPDTDPQPDAVLWRGHITMPSTRAPGDYRIVISEYETLVADQGSQEEGSLIAPLPTRRLVYADTLVV